MQTFANLSEGDCTQSESGHDSLETKVEGVACSTSASYLQLDAKCKKKSDAITRPPPIFHSHNGVAVLVLY